MCPAPAPTDDTTVTLGIMRDIVTEVARRGVKVCQNNVVVGCLMETKRETRKLLKVSQ